jgi:hypothetical protein
MRLVTATLIVLGVLSLMGCGGNSAARSGNVTIFTQPASQAVPIGRAATFTVAASGPNLTYQWNSNGVEISGATASSYTTPTVSLADSGSTYQVTVSSGSDSLASNIATLTAGPRAPAIGDLRYLLWQQMPGPLNNASIGAGEFGGGIESSYPNALGTPISMDTGGTCGWNFNFQLVPTSMDGQYTTSYEEDFTTQQSWQSYLQSLGPDNVVISADLEWTTCDEIAVAYVQTETGGFTYNETEVAPSVVASTVQAAGQAHQVVTAVTYDSTTNDWVLISYSWTGDTTTVYESQAIFIPAGESSVVSQQVDSDAGTLASQGYFISAFGGNNTDGYAMVGMRVQGDTMPRPLELPSGSVAGSPDDAQWSVIAYLGGLILEQ